jgi:hypothetical protein
MRVFRELYIHGTPHQLIEITKHICNSLKPRWTHDTDAEVHMRGIGGTRTPRTAYCFVSPESVNRPKASIILADDNKNSLRVLNIVPHKSPRLSYDQYNAILEDFYALYVKPAIDAVGGDAELTEPEADLERWLSPQSADKLRYFCISANKHTGSVHPADRESWYDFLTSVHNAGEDLGSSTLARWLQESGGWDDEWADKLAIEYEFALGLLEYFDKARAGV